MSEETGLTKIENTVAKLFATKTPKQFIKQRPAAGGMPVKYVEIGYVINELNKAFGICWEFKVIDKQVGKKQLWVQGQLTVKDPKTGFSITKETFGGAVIKIGKTSGEAVNIASDLKAAVSDCTKKCASMFGIAADVFFKEQDQYEQMGTVVDVDDGEARSIKIIALKKYFAVCKERQMDGDEAKRIIKTTYAVEHMDDLTTAQIEEATANLQSSARVIEAEEEDDDGEGQDIEPMEVEEDPGPTTEETKSHVADVVERMKARNKALGTPAVTG